MNKILFLLAVISISAFSPAFGQSTARPPADAEAAMLKFVELNNKRLLRSDEARKLFTGEAAKWDFEWFGQVLGKPDKIVSVETDYSVAKVQMLGKNLRVVDLYFYLKFDDGWKVRMMRAMAQTDLLETIATALENKTGLSDEENETLANTRLVLSSDHVLTQWFQASRLELNNLTKLATLETEKKAVRPIAPKGKTRNGVSVAVVVNPTIGQGHGSGNDSDENEPRTIETITAAMQKFPKTAAALKKLHLSALEIKSTGNMEIIIGGITDNSVGLVYSPAGKPPVIDGWRYIWVEAVAPGWYLFRTT